MRAFTLAMVGLLAASLMASGVEAGQGRSAQSRPKRNLHANSSPVLNPMVTMAPGSAANVAGPYLARPAPPANLHPEGSTDLNPKTAPRLQKPIAPPPPQIRSGLGKTGHSARYFNYGGHYSLGNGGASMGSGGGGSSASSRANWGVGGSMGAMGGGGSFEMGGGGKK